MSLGRIQDVEDAEDGAGQKGQAGAYECRDRGLERDHLGQLRGREVQLRMCLLRKTEESSRRRDTALSKLRAAQSMASPPMLAVLTLPGCHLRPGNPLAWA